ncbi:MgtC/SapB family protein [Pseudanabaena sp. FACHB-2040]|uniref:MgtC/SapB family protein n=1 Tax=Pseudanabaena sp. FACHB-2040 TaxID=2692859 RepID=UPI00168A1FBB|nr:MgtC/SapB family protein [Pseudanabaena sp. FACHB-2040]MBD0270030.1 MgtC/SapB family protein [Cyanobacteria bacterium Co-bin8]MBD2256010.1 MgtC/SapB family protein [Pseudanabaena sp. FACHB-2040]
MLNPYALPWPELLARLLLALLLGSVVGLDRELGQKSAGLRTNMLVSLGTALFILSTVQSGTTETSSDALPRVIQGVATGVGFVGAGSIFQRDRVHGLTSAAAIWVSAAVGVAAALGQWQLGLIGVTLTLITLRVFKWVESAIK